MATTSATDDTSIDDIVEECRQTLKSQSAGFLCLLGLLVVISFATSSKHWSISIAFFLLSTCFAMCSHGLYLYHRGDSRLDKNKMAEEETSKFVVTSGGRSIEYFVWGSSKSDARVAVICHGSACTGRFFNQALYPEHVLVELNVVAISPSYPGHGGSDGLPFRRIADWPKDNLGPILEAEGVDQFFVQGASYGTAHAMATASYFGPEKCVALGLNVPYLPEPICREFGFTTDADFVLSEKLLKKPYVMLPVLSLLHMFSPLFKSALAAVSEGPAFSKESPAVLMALQADIGRTFLRGAYGQVYEMLNGDTNKRWQDPRTIQTKYTCVCYAEDDTQCPPAHGKWLAEIFSSNPGIKCEVRHEKKGLGHFTYMCPEDQRNATMTRILLSLIEGGT